MLLSGIYDALPSHIWTKAEAQEKGAGLEADIEAETLVLDTDVAALMELTRGAGVRVVLTSDTYFTREQLIRFLTAAGLSPGDIPETLFISNKHGRPKWRDLFDLVLEDLGLAAGALIHLGDNADADVSPCAARGIASVFYDKWAALPRTQDHEINIQGKAKADWLIAGGERGLTGLRSRLAHRAPADMATDLEFYWAYGAATLAPVFAAYGRWVVDTLSRAGANTAYGIMREGRFLNRVVSAVAVCCGQTIETTDLWLSRRAVVRAALWKNDFSLLSQAISYCLGPTTDDILAQLGLARSDLAETFKGPAAVDLHAPGGVTALLTAVSRSISLQSKIAEESARRRQALLTYLNKTADLVDRDYLFLLDLGYAGTIQSSLHKILAREGVETALTDLYMALNERGRENVRTGTDLRALFGDDGYDSPLVHVLERTPDVLEHACMCVEGSLDSFADGGEPILIDSQRDDTQIKQMVAMQDGIIAGVTAIMGLLGKRTDAESPLVSHAGEIVRQAMIRPTIQDSETIGCWLHEANFDLADRRAFSDLRMDASRLEFGGAEAWLNIARHEAYWPAAALVRISPHMADIAASILDAGIASDTAASGAMLGALVICPDLGVGFDEKRQVAAALSLTPLGRGEIELTVKPFGADAFEQLRLSWPKARSVISIDQCAVVFRGEEQSSSADVIQKIIFEGDVHERDGMITMGPAGARAVISIGELVPPWPHALDLRLRFTYLRLDRLF